MSKNTEKLGCVDRTSTGLRNAIFDEMDAIRSGQSNATRANAVAKLASGIVETVRLEIEVQKHLEKVDTTSIKGTLGAPLSLGS
jgi:hypothetical protein